MRTQRKILALLISIILAMSILPAAALADEETSGTCGDSLTWNFDEERGILTISGNGAMTDYSKAEDQPWHSHASSITQIVLEEGITKIGAHAFRQISGINSELKLPASLENIGACALYMTPFTAFSVENGNEHFSSDENGVLYTSDNFTLYAYPIGSDAKSYTADSSLTKIQSYAFSSAKNLTSVDFSAATKLSSIGQQAFEGASNVDAVFKGNGTITVDYEALKGLNSVCLDCNTLNLAPYALKDTKYIDLTNVDSIDATLSGWWGSNAVFVNNGLNNNVVAGATRIYTNSNELAEYLSKLPIRDQSTKAPDIAVIYDGSFSNAADFISDDLVSSPERPGYLFVEWDTGTDYTITTISGNKELTAKIYASKWTLKAPTVEVTADKTNVVTGKSVTLTANAEHELEDVTYAYQWYRGDTVIEGATGKTCTAENLTDDAAYSCSVTASKDDKTSEAATGSVAIKVSAREGTLTLSAASGEVLTTAGQVSLTYDYNGDGPVTASSSDESVATVAVDQTAKKVTVTVQKAGTAVITVSAGATDTYTAASAVYRLTVKEPAPVTPGGGSSSGGSSTPAYSVTVDSGRHGTVTVSPKSARKGATVTITVNPDDGYELDGLTVTDASGKAVKVTEGKNGKFTFTMPASKVEVDATFTAIKEETPAQRFTDVPNGYWAEEEINWAAENGYINGNTAATFNPEGTVTRQQLWMILARLSGYQPADFTEARAWAVDNSISDGTNPGGAVSRQQLVTILYRYAERMGHNTAGSADLTAYPDHADLAAYAADAMAWSVANNIVGGTAQGTLAPAGTATRAQFAVILYRFCDKVVG